jgi:beta-mannosidase
LPAEVLRLDEWEAAAGDEPREWLRAPVPTAAAVVREHGLEPRDLDAEDWWFRTRFRAEAAEAGEEVVLRFGGIATVAEVSLNGEPLLESASMFVARDVDVGPRLRGENELVVRCRALAPLLAAPRKPRARWRTRVADNGLRWHRTTILGRAPGFAPGPAPVGLWRPVELERRRGLVVEELRVRPRLDGADGVLALRLRVRALEGAVPGAVLVRCGHVEGTVPTTGAGELRLPAVEPWWPHTHGEPALHELRVSVGEEEVVRRVGFRRLEPGPEYDVDSAALALRVNGVTVFVRGAVWTPPDFEGFRPDGLRAALELVGDSGLNMLRLPGTGPYESDAFHDLCDELGILVWQDFAFANFDYPIADDGFRALVEEEARQALARLGGRPSTAVLCGGSEVEQQAAMLGLDPALGRGELFGELLPALAREAEVDAPYVPSSPSGGDLPFRFDRGVSHYFGVGGYRRPLEDARLAGVGFASECLAFSNLPDEPPYEPVPGDVGADWDFADVRDRYLALLYDGDPEELRACDPERYLALARAAPGEAMAEVFGEWRREGSPCAGGIVLWWRDLEPGAGWGLVDHAGRPKEALLHLRRVLAPVALWTTDEGLAGIDVHVANDRPEPLRGRLRVTLYRDLELRVDGAEEEVEVPPHGSLRRNLEAMLRRFVDASYAYRFGPPGHDAVVAALEPDGGEPIRAVRFPAGRPAPLTAAELGLEAEIAGGELVARTGRIVHGLRGHVPGTVPWTWLLEPGQGVHWPLPEGTRSVRLTALNLAGSLEVRA